MYIPKPGQLPKAELDVMRVLWEHDRPMSASEIVSALSQSRSWKTATAHVILKRLMEKAYIDADRDGHTHRYYPRISENEYQTSLLKNVMGLSVKSMVASLIDCNEVSDDEIFELAELLEKKRDEIKNRGCK